MKAMRTRLTALTLIAVFAAVGVAACGSSSSSSSSSKSAAAAGGAGAPSSAQRAKLATCLKQHGVTLPTGGFKGRPTGQRGFFGGGGGGAGGARFANPKFRAAFQACGAAGFRGRPGGRRFRPNQAAITKFASCVKQHGYTLPKANLSGSGPVYPAKIERNQKFQSAAKSCQSVLRPAGGGSST